jgi:hypothetical protein
MTLPRSSETEEENLSRLLKNSKSEQASALLAVRNGDTTQGVNHRQNM